MWTLERDGDAAILLPRIKRALELEVAEHLQGGLWRYLETGILPGSFLQAVLCNDLEDTAMRADPRSWKVVPSVIAFLREYAPDAAWGSREAVLAWTTTPERLEI